MPRQPFTTLYSLSDCVRDGLDLDVECLACGHRVVLDGTKLRKEHFVRTYWWTLPDVERALTCTVCNAKQCKMQVVDSVDGTVHELKKPAEF